MPPQKLLLATDLSCRCDRALDRAAALAAEWGAKLVVFHAVQKPPHAARSPLWRLPPDPQEVALRRVQNDLSGVEGVDVEVVVKEGDPAPLVLEVAAALGCELIVTGVARDETLGRMLMGTTVDKIVRHSEVPVLVVKLRPSGPYRSVLAATDFSDASRAALETALALLPTAQVSVFHAYDVPFETLVGDSAGSVRRDAARVAAEECEAFLAATPAVARSGRRVETILENGVLDWLLSDIAQQGVVDLVALGTTGRGGLAGVLLGSTTQRLLDSLPIDVLVVRRPRR